jgi:hypothetical protein
MSLESDRTEAIHPNAEDREVETAPAVTQVNTPRRPGAEVDRHEAVAYDPYAERRAVSWRVVQAIWLIFGVIEGLIAIRFVLKALGANASAGFAEFIYGITAPLVAPFVGLFGNPASNGSVLELNSIVALIAYGLLAWLLTKLAWLIVGEDRSAVSTRSTTIDTRS